MNDQAIVSQGVHPESKRLGALPVLVLSCVILCSGALFDYAIRWKNNYLEGLIAGFFHLPIFALSWLMFFLPWGLGVLALYRFFHWRRFRTQWVLAPVVLVIIGSLCLNPPTPSARFKGCTKSELPKNAHQLLTHFSGGGISDYYDQYFFQTTPKEVRRLIAELRVDDNDGYLNPMEAESAVFARLPNFPSVAEWEGSRVLTRRDRETGWFYELRVDASETKLLIVIGSQ